MHRKYAGLSTLATDTFVVKYFRRHIIEKISDQSNPGGDGGKRWMIYRSHLPSFFKVF